MAAPVVPALTCKKLRRVRGFFIAIAPYDFVETRTSVKRLRADFLEKYDVVVAVILQSDVAFVGTPSALRLEIEFFVGHRLAFGVVGDLYAVEFDDGVRAIEGDEPRIPFGAGLAGFGHRLGQRIERAGYVIVVFLGQFR